MYTFRFCFVIFIKGFANDREKGIVRKRRKYSTANTKATREGEEGQLRNPQMRRSGYTIDRSYHLLIRQYRMLPELSKLSNQLQDTSVWPKGVIGHLGNLKAFDSSKLYRKTKDLSVSTEGFVSWHNWEYSV